MVWVTASVAAALAAWWGISYHAWQYRGAGPLRDRGLLSHYRYQAPVGSFPFDKEGTYSFSFSGLPTESMVLQLYVPGYSTKNRQEIESLRTFISAEITDGSGVAICSASGSVQGAGASHWTLYSSPFDAALWHEACLDRPFNRWSKYTLRLSVHDVDPRTPNVNLSAVLEGGGIELP